ncbi:MAG: hypothetical protein Q8L53_09560, partial [Aestuariivirga sp.]|nr:hypothetical protein [Aestuariivirga sp.]
DLTTPVNGFWTIHSYSDMYLKFPLPVIPGWALPLGVEDNCIIDYVLMRIVSSSTNFGTEGFDLQKLQHLICFVWQHRLPVTPIELVRFLEAHGCHKSLSNETERLIKFGLDLLLWSHSRPPIKRRRISPFSQFRYAENYRSDEMRHISDWLYGPSINYLDLLKVQ